VCRPEDLGCCNEHGLVPCTTDLEEDPVLPLELDFLVVEPPGEKHQAVEFEQVGLVVTGRRLGTGCGSSSHGPKIAQPPDREKEAGNGGER
jgi:hypothetical protein